MSAKQIRKAKKRIENIREGTEPSVSFDKLKLRRDKCRECDKVSKSTDTKYSMFKGLYFQSQCKLTKMSLLEGLPDPNFSCPMKKF
jgi:hypothetical protein